MDRRRSDYVRAVLEDMLGARYEILDLHGHGGMGLVFCARARALEQLFAIKVLTPDLALTTTARERFRREARLAASLSHPSIVRVFEYDETGEFPYLIMEFVRGESLAHRLRHEGRLLPEVTRGMLLDLADALDYAHRRGIIHRDLKPENILIGAESGRALLTDFGIAKALSDSSHLTDSQGRPGTPEYMSPEYAAGEQEIDHRTDLYSLGAVGYTMLAGRPPHQGNGYLSVIARHLTEEPVPLRQLVPEAPEDLVAAISRCLEKQPERRWSDARALHQALAREAGEDEAVSEELRAITGFGTFVILVLVAALSWAARSWSSGDGAITAVAAFGGLLVTIGFLIYARDIAAKGYALRDVLRVSMWPPKWWGIWWPRVLRRPGDVWECLPRSARLTRVLLTLMFASMVTWLVAAPSLSDTGRSSLRWLVIGLAAAVVVIVASNLARSRTRRFPMRDATRLLFGPTIGTTFWGQPHVKAVLGTRAGAASACAAPVPATIRGILYAIEASAQELTGSARPGGADAADAAHLLVDDVERLDAEIENLTRGADPEELARIERRLAELSDTQQDAREHLEAYAKLMRAQADRLEVKRLDRDDAAGTLRSIWAVLEQLRGTPDGAELLQRLQSLSAAARGRMRVSGVPH